MRKALVAMSLALAVPALADGRTIVGEWALDKPDCGTQYAYKIEPLGIFTDEMRCKFRSVARKGDVVRFEGKCDDGGDATPETVVATRSGDRLALTYLKAGGGVKLVACPRQAAARAR